MQWYQVVSDRSLHSRFVAFAPGGVRLASGETLSSVLPAIDNHADSCGVRHVKIRYVGRGYNGELSRERVAS